MPFVTLDLFIYLFIECLNVFLERSRVSLEACLTNKIRIAKILVYGWESGWERVRGSEAARREKIVQRIEEEGRRAVSQWSLRCLRSY